MRGRGIALGKVPKNPGMDQWMPDPDPVDPDLYDLSQFYYSGGNGSLYDDWASDYDPCVPVPADPMFVEDKVSFALRMWAPPVLIVFGLFGNILSAYIMNEFSDRYLSSCLYFTLLSVTEILVLVLRSGNDWLRTVHQIDFTKLVLLRSNASCEVYSFVTSFIYHLCSWLVVVPVAEMAIMARDFSQAHKISTMSRIKNTVLITVFFVIFVNAHFFFTFALLDPEWDPLCGRRQCTFIPGAWGEMFRDWLWPVLGDNIFALLGPIMSVFLCLTYILVKSNCGSQASAKNKIMNNRFFMDNKAWCDYRLICIVMAVFFLCTAIPEAGYNMYEFILEKAGENESTDIMSYVKRELAMTIGSFLRDLFLSTKVIIYASCWSHFRRRLFSIISIHSHIIGPLRNRKKLAEQRFGNERKVMSKGGDTDTPGTSSEEVQALTQACNVTRYEHCV